MPPSATLENLRARAAHLSSERSVSTLTLGILVALATWFVTLNNPAPGLDPSWGAGLYMALHKGLPFGSEVVFTYGPLGFLINSVGWYGGLQELAFVWLALLHVAFACALIWALRRSYGAFAAALLTFVILALLVAVEVPFALAAIACFAVLQLRPPRHVLVALIVAGAAFASIEMLVKLSVGPPVFVMFAIALIGARARLAQLALYVGVFAAGVLILWLASGQALADLSDYVVNGRQIVSGYSEAMILTKGSELQHTLSVVAAFVGLIALIAYAAMAPYRDQRARWCGVAIAALAGFALLKEGVVRSDVSHLSAYFSTMVAFWIAIPWGRGRRLIPFLGAAVLLVLSATLELRKDPGRAWELMNPIENVDRAYTQADKLFHPGQRSEEREFARVFMKAGYRLDESMLSALEGHSVAIDPWEIAVAWAYDLDWSPLPVFQNYSAYTSELDQLNAGLVSSPEGPERILRQNPAKGLSEYATRAIDGRYPAWDPPAQAIATLCNFDVLQTTPYWQLLGRVPDRCGEPEPIGSAQSAYDEKVSVPQARPGEVVFVRIHGAEVSGVESLRSLLYRANTRFAVVNGKKTYRLIPGTAADGLLLDGAPQLTGRGILAQAPQAETIELTGLDGGLRYDFYSMTVDRSSTGADGES